MALGVNGAGEAGTAAAVAAAEEGVAALPPPHNQRDGVERPEAPVSARTWLGLGLGLGSGSGFGFGFGLGISDKHLGDRTRLGLAEAKHGNEHLARGLG